MEWGSADLDGYVSHVSRDPSTGCKNTYLGRCPSEELLKIRIASGKVTRGVHNSCHRSFSLEFQLPSPIVSAEPFEWPNLGALQRHGGNRIYPIYL